MHFNGNESQVMSFYSYSNNKSIYIAIKCQKWRVLSLVLDVSATDSALEGVDSCKTSNR